MEKIEKIPDDITPVLLSCVLMPNGEIISLGKQVGMFEDYKEYVFNHKKENA